MMTDDEKEQLLDRYVQGMLMSADEKAQVSQLLRTDANFRADYQMRQALFNAGVQQRRNAWEARRQAQPTRHNVPTGRRAFPMRWVAAASVTLLLGIGWLWWVRTPAVGPARLSVIPLYEQRDTQLSLAGSDSAVGSVTWKVQPAAADTYQFDSVDRLVIYSRHERDWQGVEVRLTRLSETRYRLKAGSRTYLLEQGRSLRLPLHPEP